MVALLEVTTPGKVERDLVQRELMRCDTTTLDTVPLAEEKAAAYWQQDIPDDYLKLAGPDLVERIAAARARLGSSTVVLGHHYQREDIIQFADLRGDSLKLARWASEQKDAEHIVFCGVHFMAEAADILSGPEQKVILPNLRRVARWPTSPTRTTSMPPGTSWMSLDWPRNRAGYVHQLGCLAEGVLRGARRHRLHVVERAARAGVGAQPEEAGTVLP